MNASRDGRSLQTPLPTSPPTNPPRVTVIIPTFNGAHLLPTCLDSVLRQTFRDFEIVVVDDASTDDTHALLARAYPSVRVITQATHRGFAAAVNAGIRQARGDIIALLNNDTEAEPTWLAELVSALDANSHAGMAASKLRLFERRDHLHSAGDFYRVDGIPGNRGVWEKDAGQYDDPAAPPPLFGACAGAAAYRRALFDALGGLDEDLGSYCEDVDLNWRARLAGFDCVLAPRAVVYHMVSATGGGARASYYVGRNFITVLVKDYPGALWRKYWRRILGAQFAITREALRNWRGTAARARLRGQLAGLAAIPRFRRKRQAVQAARRVDLAEIERVLTQVHPETKR